jgi:hypothetical protein
VDIGSREITVVSLFFLCLCNDAWRKNFSCCL